MTSNDAGDRRAPALPDGRARAARSLRDGIGGFGPHFGKAIGQGGQDVGDELGALEVSKRAHRRLRRQRVGAANPGSNRGEVGRIGGAPIFRLENGQSRGVDGLCEGRRRQQGEQEQRVPVCAPPHVGLESR